MTYSSNFLYCKSTQCVNILKNTDSSRVFFLCVKTATHKRTSFQPRVGNFSNAWEQRVKEVVPLWASSSTDSVHPRQKGAGMDKLEPAKTMSAHICEIFLLRVFTKVSRISSQSLIVSSSRCLCVWMQRVHVNIDRPEIMIELYGVLSKFCKKNVYKKPLFRS